MALLKICLTILLASHANQNLFGIKGGEARYGKWAYEPTTELPEPDITFVPVTEAPEIHPTEEPEIHPTHEPETEEPEIHPTHQPVTEAPEVDTSKMAVMNRMYSEKETDYLYTIDRHEEKIIAGGCHGYKTDQIMGRIVLIPEDFQTCSKLVPIYKLTHVQHSTHALVVASLSHMRMYQGWTWTLEGIIGYAVKEPGQCGATVPVYYYLKGPHNDYSKGYHVQTTNETELALPGNGVGSSPTFYIWKA